MRKFIAAGTLIFAVILSAFAQTPAAPDFSGSWVLNVAQSKFGKDGAPKSGTLMIEKKKASVILHYNTDGKKSTETYTPDGKQHVAYTEGKSKLMAVANWRDSKLVIESTLDLGIPNLVVTGLKPVVDTWSLSADGKTLTNDADDHKETYVYDKQ